MKTLLVLSLVLFLLPMTYLAKDAGSEFISVDSCLDSGGSYDYHRDTCDKMENHLYIPYFERKMNLILTCSFLSLVGLGTFMGIRRKRQRNEKTSA